MAELTDEEYQAILNDPNTEIAPSMIIGGSSDLEESINNDSSDAIYAGYNQSGSSSTFTTSGWPLLSAVPSNGWNPSTPSVASKTTTAPTLLDALSNAMEIKKSSETSKVEELEVISKALKKQTDLIADQNELIRGIADSDHKIRTSTNKILSKIASQLLKKNALDTVVASSTIAKNKTDKVLNDSNFTMNNKAYSNIELATQKMNSDIATNNSIKSKNDSDIATNTKINESLDFNKNGISSLKDTSGKVIKPREAKALKDAEKAIDEKRANETDITPILTALETIHNDTSIDIDIMTKVIQDMVDGIDVTKIDTNGKES